MKVTSKQADATLARLTNAMQRNTTLATGAGKPLPQSGPVSTYVPAPVPVAVTATRRNGRTTTSGIRLKEEEHAKIRGVIQAGLALEVNLSASDVIRLALHAYKPQQLAAADISWLQARDGRTQTAKLRDA